tara:strand:+ start:1445 stop:1690 length:246 start_codon:yes stop_codon:yes gene_type:complete
MANRRTVKEVSEDLDSHITRLYALEDAHTDLDLRHRLLHKDVKANSHDVDEIQNYFKWFMKVVITLFASAVVAFIVQGGLI